MDLAKFREYCLGKANAAESTPFGPDVLVFKVSGKIFALASLDEVPATANLKCDPDLALELRDRCEQVTPRLPHEQEALEHGGDRKRNPGYRVAENDRSLVRARREQFAEVEARSQQR